MSAAKRCEHAHHAEPTLRPWLALSLPVGLVLCAACGVHACPDELTAALETWRALAGAHGASAFLHRLRAWPVLRALFATVVVTFLASCPALAGYLWGGGEEVTHVVKKKDHACDCDGTKGPWAKCEDGGALCCRTCGAVCVRLEKKPPGLPDVPVCPDMPTHVEGCAGGRATCSKCQQPCPPAVTPAETTPAEQP